MHGPEQIADLPVPKLTEYENLVNAGRSAICSGPCKVRSTTRSRYVNLPFAILAHDKPTLLLTNQLRRSATKLIDRYAQRMLIENGDRPPDGIDFYPYGMRDSSAVAMKVNCDLQLTLMASSLYRLLGTELGKEYTNAKSRRGASATS